MIHPWRQLTLLGATADAYGAMIARSFIGVTGWLDIGLWLTTVSSRLFESMASRS